MLQDIFLSHSAPLLFFPFISFFYSTPSTPNNLFFIYRNTPSSCLVCRYFITILYWRVRERHTEAAAVVRKINLLQLSYTLARSHIISWHGNKMTKKYPRMLEFCHFISDGRLSVASSKTILDDDVENNNNTSFCLRVVLKFSQANYIFIMLRKVHLGECFCK